MILSTQLCLLSVQSMETYNERLKSTYLFTSDKTLSQTGSGDYLVDRSVNLQILSFTSYQKYNSVHVKSFKLSFLILVTFDRILYFYKHYFSVISYHL